MPPANEEHPTRQRILEAARRLFHEQGFHATGISTILREADVNSGSLYHYFASKEALLSGVLTWYLDLLRPMVMNPVEGMTEDPIGRIFALLGFYRQGLAMTDFKMGCPIGNLALEVGDGLALFRSFRNAVDQHENVDIGEREQLAPSESTDGYQRQALAEASAQSVFVGFSNEGLDLFLSLPKALCHCDHRCGFG